MQFSSNVTDSEGIKRAYEADDGFFAIGDTLYISGTRNMEDITHDWIKLPQGKVKQTKKYQDAMEFISKLPGGKPKRIVGHSLGAQIAQSLAERWGVEGRAYGSPSYSLLGNKVPEFTTRYKRNWDPVGILDRQAKSNPSPSWWPHSYSGYEVRSNETVS